MSVSSGIYVTLVPFYLLSIVCGDVLRSGMLNIDIAKAKDFKVL